MKISQMLKREDFYSVNEKTLNEYFKGRGKRKTLYVYPELNAIITANPSKNIKKYLMTEYSVKGNFLKALIAKCYVFVCLNLFGIMASKKISICCDVTNDVLIYPCNKKYRIFNFKNKTVDVVAKNGFPTNDLKHEIQFRVNNNLPFVPEIIKFGEDFYTERIIEGVPLARYGGDAEKYKNNSLNVLAELSEIRGESKKVFAGDYSKKLYDLIICLLDKTSKNIDRTLLVSVADKFFNAVDENKEVEIGISHGDLQSGNIWVDQNSEMIIIDWESWGIRSNSYDKAVLYNNLRNGGLESFISKSSDKTEMAIVCLEDILYRIEELNNLPFDYGEKQFGDYLKVLLNA